MTKYELEEKIGKMYADLYWFRRNPQWWHDKGENLNVERHQILITQYAYMLDHGDYQPELNSRGNEIERSFRPTERYEFDVRLKKRDGWTQYDTNQDAPYFGVWVNSRLRQTFTYCEGDHILVKCPTEESFQAEIEDMNRCYGPPPPAWKVYGMDGSVTHIFDDDSQMGRSLPACLMEKLMAKARAHGDKPTERSNKNGRTSQSDSNASQAELCGRVEIHQGGEEIRQQEKRKSDRRT